MKRQLIITAAVIAALAATAAYFRFVPGSTPAGQPPLTRLELADFQQRFRTASDGTRVVAFFSPT
ncbi:MAG TPA: hypothetical protein VLW65_01000 [Bryobacteraceae bacterium]|nr:hypothetical protein [Bryobacteraceae bacterium]